MQLIYEILNDPSTPYWAKDVIRIALTKDPIDASNVLHAIARAFNERATEILRLK